MYQDLKNMRRLTTPAQLMIKYSGPLGIIGRRVVLRLTEYYEVI